MVAWLTVDCLIITATEVTIIMRTSLSFLTCTETVIMIDIMEIRTGDPVNRCLQSGSRAPSNRTEGPSLLNVDFSLLAADFDICIRPPGLVQSVLAPVIGLSSLNLAYSPGAKRIDVMAR